MKFRLIGCVVVALLASTRQGEAAAGTTCLCRNDNGVGFYETTLRHHRWACDFRFGYTSGDPNIKAKPRPAKQTCNAEEIIQWKVYLCVSRGCTYAYAKSTEEPNKALEAIEALAGERRP